MDENLAHILDRSDQILKDHFEEDGYPVRQRAWDVLETIPAHHEFHVEVLKRRLQLIYGNDQFKDLPKAVRWARALVEAEPDEVPNWWWLDDAVERLEGKEAAVEVLRKGLEHCGPDFSLYYEISSHLCALDRLEEAQEAMLLALKQDPFALDSALKSDSFLPIRDYIRELKESDWYTPTQEWLEKNGR